MKIGKKKCAWERDDIQTHTQKPGWLFLGQLMTGKWRRTWKPKSNSSKPLSRPPFERTSYCSLKHLDKCSRRSSRCHLRSKIRRPAKGRGRRAQSWWRRAVEGSGVRGACPSKREAGALWASLCAKPRASWASLLHGREKISVEPQRQRRNF